MSYFAEVGSSPTLTLTDESAAKLVETLQAALRPQVIYSFDPYQMMQDAFLESQNKVRSAMAILSESLPSQHPLQEGIGETLASADFDHRKQYPALYIQGDSGLTPPIYTDNERWLLSPLKRLAERFPDSIEIQQVYRQCVEEFGGGTELPF